MTDYTARMIQNLFDIGEHYNVPVKIEPGKITVGDAWYNSTAYNFTESLNRAYVHIAAYLAAERAKIQESK